MSAPFRGTVVGTASSLGEVTLTRGGKAVSTLKSGRYKFVIDDTTAHSGFLLDRPNGTTLVVTSLAFVGKRTVTVTLNRGHWGYHGALGSIHKLTVVA
jgi:hypothetical protein